MIRCWLIIILAGAVCSCQSRGYTIEGKLEAPRSEAVELLSVQDEVILTADIDERGRFFLSGNVSEPGLYFLRLQKDYIRIPVWLENADYRTESEGRDLWLVSGNRKSVQNRYALFEKTASAMEREYMEIGGKYTDEGTGFEEKVILSEVMDSLFTVRMDYVTATIAELKGNPLACYLADRYLLFFENDYKRLGEIAAILGEGEDPTGMGSRIAQAYAKLEAGRLTGKAPGFELENMEGNRVSLASFNGKYVLVDFWASWCAPCRKKNKQLNRNYDQLKAAGLVIISISLDTDRTAWKKAVAEDGIQWIQLIDDSGFDESSVRRAWKFSQVPSVFLIGPDGDILETNPDPDGLLEWLKKRTL